MESILQHSSDYAFLCDAEGTIGYVNPALRKAMGYEASEPISKEALFVRSAGAAFRAAVRNSLDRRLPATAIKVFCRTKLGESIPLVGCIIPHTDQTCVCLFPPVVSQGHNNGQLNAILQAIPDVLMVFDVQGRYRRIFTADQSLLVHSADYLLGKTIHEVMSEHEAEIGSAIISKVIESGQPAETTHRLTIDQKSRWFSVRVVPIKDEGEDCALWLSRDVTDTYLGIRRRAANDELLQGLLHIQERERQLLAGELHDGFVQEVVGARMWLESIEHEWKNAPETAKDALEVVRKSIDQAIVQARQLISSLRPIITDHLGIEAGLQALVDQFDRESETRIMFQASGNLGPLFPLLESALIRICQEALKNIVYHSQAKLATVEIARHGQWVRLVIEDDRINGDGAHEQPLPAESIIDRAEIFGGQAQVEQSPAGGIKIVASFPAIPPKDDFNDVTAEFSAMMLDRAESKAAGESNDD